jgi:LysM repeat protein
MDYEQMAEPNMKLSRALLIVLLLHIVAIAGIIAFNTIKTREATVVGGPEASAPANTTAISTPAVAEQAVAPAPNEITKVAARTESKAPDRIAEKPKPAPKTSEVEDSGKIYVVVKGDNPVTIARHLHVNYDALLGLNQIEDPRKLQIGQKLHIPAAVATTKHKSD